MASATIKDVARELGISPSTVSLALRNSPKLPSSTIDRIKEAARSLNYRPNMMAKGLVGGKTNSIGIIMGTLSDLFHVGLVAGAEEFFSQKGYSVIFYLTHFKEGKLFESISNIISRGVDGVVMFGVQSVRYGEVLQRFKEANCPVTLYDFPDFTGEDNVIYHNDRNAEIVVEHLYRLGHRKIALLDENVGSWREPSFRNALRRFGLECNPDFIQKIDSADFGGSIRNCRQVLMSMKERPTAIFAYNDDVAMRLIQELQMAGFKIPEDVSVVGVNGLWYTEMSTIPLTTLYLPCREAGWLCAEMLVDRIQNPQQPVSIRKLEGRLIVRQSTAATQPQFS